MAALMKITAVLVLACLFPGRLDASPQENPELDDLKKTLQNAIELEWSTIPVYLNAHFSLKDKQGKNKQVSEMMRDILVNEMHHMSLAANILNAIGGFPVLNDLSRAPRYPGPLPAGCLPDLTVSLQKMSKDHIENVFMAIETPECDHAVRKFHGDLIKAASQKESNERLQMSVTPKFPGLQEKCKEEKGTYNPTTIGAIYIHKILCPMLKLELEGDRKVSIFTKDHSRQVEHPFKVTNLTTAIKAIAYIVSQGEGGDPCNPFVYSDFRDDDYKKQNKEEPSHYYKFAEIAKGKEVTVQLNDQDNPACPLNDPDCNYFSPCSAGTCDNAIRFINKPEKPYFNEDAVWNIIPNPTTGIYPPGSVARKLSDEFNEIYVDLMQCLHDAVNGQPQKLQRCVVCKMHQLKEKGDILVQTPIIPGGDVNASPTYEFFYTEQDKPEEHNQQRLQQQHIEL
ncbi:uncharacterized protein LOC118408838 [Branchiostoma floridae]|uniref:Uncharacterized protein LOC118408838 n=1 Tax=Branchiostoma floridae TaxID=7739 RepID=A0A9J7HTH9_BRAFL|nr:uncharacterized protein LOC118408838 [Branchiostoma floridae]